MFMVSSRKKHSSQCFPISSIPWASFTGFNLNINNEGDFLLPIITCGKYFNEENKVMLPVSLQVHHSVL